MTPKAAAGLTASILVSLGVGFVAGQEYVRYELRTALAGVASGFQRALADSSSASTPEATARPAGSPDQHPLPAPAADPSPPPAPAPPSPIEATMTSKGFIASDAQRGQFQDYITVKFTFKNVGTKDIRAFSGNAYFTDLLGNKIETADIAYNKTIAAGKTVVWEGSIDYNQFEQADVALRNADPADMKTSFKIGKALYVDGSTIDWPAD